MSKARGLADLGNAYSDGALSNRNILINGNLTVNQRNLSIASVATGAYGEDRWKKTAGGMTQIIEELNYLPSTEYTLSGTGITTQQITSPASGDWTLPDISVTARLIQLEVGDTATPFEHRSYGDELARCQRYCWQVTIGDFGNQAVIGVGHYNTTTQVIVQTLNPVTMRAVPTLSYSDLSHFDIEPWDKSLTSLVSSGYGNGRNFQLVAVPSTADSTGDAASIIIDTSGGWLRMDAEL